MKRTPASQRNVLHQTEFSSKLRDFIGTSRGVITLLGFSKISLSVGEQTYETPRFHARIMPDGESDIKFLEFGGIRPRASPKKKTYA